MSVFTKEISIRWSDLDPNFHLRHSAYYDFGAQHRIEILEEQGLTLRVMQQGHFGPVLFRVITSYSIHYTKLYEMDGEQKITGKK